MKFNIFSTTTLLLLLAFAATGMAQENGKEKSMSENRVVVIVTNLGNISIELDYARAPISCANFEQYVNDGFYNGTIFHRVISNFMIQGGGFTVDGKQKETRETIANEAGNGLSNTLGTVAMARTSVVNSATAQFFINVKDNLFLDHRDDTVQGYGYAVFGHVVEGMETVNTLRDVKTGVGPMGMQDWPTEPVVIEKMYFAE